MDCSRPEEEVGPSPCKGPDSEKQARMAASAGFLHRNINYGQWISRLRNTHKIHVASDTSQHITRGDGGAPHVSVSALAQQTCWDRQDAERTSQNHSSLSYQGPGVLCPGIPSRVQPRSAHYAYSTAMSHEVSEDGRPTDTCL